MYHSIRTLIWRSKGRSGGLWLFNFRNLNSIDLNLTATTNPYLGAAIDLHGKWLTCHYCRPLGLDSGHLTALIYLWLKSSRKIQDIT